MVPSNHREEDVMSEKVPGEKPGTTTHYTVDGSLQTTTLEAMTPREILQDAGLDPQTHSLRRVEGGQRIPCDDVNRPVPIWEHEQFVTSEKEDRVAGPDKKESGWPGGGRGRTDVTGVISDKIRVDPDLTEGHPGYQDSGGSEMGPPER